MFDDCYAKRGERCIALTQMICDRPCPFYATKDEYTKRLKQSESIIKSKGLRVCVKYTQDGAIISTARCD